MRQTQRSTHVVGYGSRAPTSGSSLGLYGCSARPMGLPQSAGAEAWGGYARWPSVCALGRCAITISAAHDEEGGTHKPFQIAASRVPRLHRATAGFTDLVAPGIEVLPFTHGPPLLDAVRRAADPAARRELADAMRVRARRDHRWDDRLGTMLAHAFRTFSRPLPPPRPSPPATAGSPRSRASATPVPSPSPRPSRRHRDRASPPEAPPSPRR